jgi:Ca2+-binding EF-hand superfamily protein
VDIGPKFDYAVEKDLNFLDATSRQSIDYSNLGNYMRFVKSEFDNAYMTKKSQKSED